MSSKPTPGDANAHQQQMFEDSPPRRRPREELEALIAQFDAHHSTVTMTTDRHWTWTARK